MKLVVLLVSLLALCLPLISAQITLRAANYVVVQSTDESPAVSLMLTDIERDLYTVTGVAPLYLNAPPTPGQLPPSTVIIYLGSTSKAPWLSSFSLPDSCTSQWEAHCVCVFTGGQQGTNSYDSIVATGAGDRGAIFGGYSFSENILGFPPLFLMTDTPAPYAGPEGISINDSFSMMFPSPKFKYRALFPNDEDLTGGHRADPLGANVFDLAAWDVFYQTALRMKANMMLIGTNPYPDDTATALAARRGLVISHHHYDLLGSNVFSWPLGTTDWNWDLDAGTMAYIWRAAIAAQANYEVVWSVGLRGLNDYPYVSCSSLPDCGRVISDAIRNQTSWVRSTPGQENATIILYTWDEVLQLLVGGYLELPPNITFVFTDSGQGYINTDGNWTEYAQGVYYHTAMYNGQANQLTEMVPVSRIISQMLNVINKALATEVFVLNLSDLRPVPMTTAAAMELVWNPTPFAANPNANATALAWYAQWGVTYLGLDSNSPYPATYAALWQQYFDVSYIFAGRSDLTLATDVVTLSQTLAAAWAAGHGASTANVASANASYIALGGDASLAQLSTLNASAWSLLKVVPASRRGFFYSHMLLQFSTQLANVEAIQQLVLATSSLLQSNSTLPSTTSALKYIATALESFDQMLSLRRAAEGDATTWSSVVNIPSSWPLRGYYLNDRLADMQRARSALAALQLALQSPPRAPQMLVRPYAWYTFEDYQAAAAPNYPLFQFNPLWNLPTYVRINCQSTNVAASTCNNAADGGWFVASSNASITMQVMNYTTGSAVHSSTLQAMTRISRSFDSSSTPSSLVIRYTLDATAPTPQSSAYSTPLQLSSLLVAPSTRVIINSMAWINGVATGQVTTTTWNTL